MILFILLALQSAMAATPQPSPSPKVFTFELPKEHTDTFSFVSTRMTEILRITDKGEIYLRGKLIGKDKALGTAIQWPVDCLKRK